MNPSPETEKPYDPVSIALHWATVVLVLMLFTLAIFPGIAKWAIALHKSLGLSLFALVLLLIVWRLTFGRKRRHDPSEPAFLRLAARAAHMALYALLLSAPVLGWLYMDAKAVDVHPFVLQALELPSILYYDRHLAMAIYGWKQVVVYSLLALIVVHAAAAVVYHGFIRSDGVLNAMLPRRYRRYP